MLRDVTDRQTDRQTCSRQTYREI